MFSNKAISFLKLHSDCPRPQFGKWSKWIMAIAICNLLFSTFANNVLADIDFSQPTDLRKLRILHAGNYGTEELKSYHRETRAFQIGPVEIDQQKRYPLVLFSGYGKAWVGAAIDFNAAQLPTSGTIRVTVWLKTNQPTRVRLMATEGGVVGGGCFKKIVQSFTKQYERHALSAELARFNPGDGFSVGCYIEYEHDSSRDGQVLAVIDRILVEHLSASTAVGMGTTTVIEGITDYDLPLFAEPYSFMSNLFPANEAAK